MASQRRTQLLQAVEVMVNVVRTVRIKRVFHELEPDPHLCFWRVIYANSMDIAVLDWCKLFGSDHQDYQPIHWKRVIQDHGEFRNGLFAALDADRDQWGEYWLGMKRYRDTYAAHSDFRARQLGDLYPDLSWALESTCFYYAQIGDELRSMGYSSFPEDLNEYGDRFTDLAAGAAGNALASTADIQETVDYGEIAQNILE